MTFSKPINPVTATNLLNYGYSVRTAGRDQRFGTRDDLLIPITSAVYNPFNLTVTLTFARVIHPPTPFQFAINQATDVAGAGVGVADLAGNLLDGNNNGIPGGPYIRILSGKAGGIVPSSVRSVSAQEHPAAPACGASSLRQGRGFRACFGFGGRSRHSRPIVSHPSLDRVRSPRGRQFFGEAGINA